MTGIRGRLAGIVGRRASYAFGVVTLLAAGLLAAIHLSSRHALKLYIEDQLSRLAWDVALYQTSEFSLSAEVSPRLRAVPGIERVESLTFLRTKPPAEAILEVDGKPLATPWLSLLAATDVSLLPPEARPQRGSSSSPGAILALVGPERHMGQAFLALQRAKVFTVAVASHREGTRRQRFMTLPLSGVVRLERSELNRYFMNEIGSISFVPYIGVILVVPHDVELLRRFDALSRGAVGEHGDVHVTAGEYLPEVVHLSRIDRRLISGWDIPASLEKLRTLHAAVEEQVTALSPTLFVDNALLVLLTRMNEISRLIGLATFLIAVPLLVIAWMMASTLSGLLILNERRTFGLMRLRGVPGKLLGEALLLSIGVGGLLGGVGGLLIGTLLPLAVYEGGWPSWDVVSHVQGPLVMLLFLIVGLGLTLLISRRLIRYATTIPPLEASRRVAVSEVAEARVRFSFLPLVSLLVGGYKIASWMLGFFLSGAIPLPEEAGAVRSAAVFTLRILDRTLDFVALPLFVYGVVTLVVSRRRWMSGLLGAVTLFIGGKLRGLSLTHMSGKPHRIAGFLLIVALMASISLYPSITATSFEDRARRGATVQVGSELHLTLSPLDLVDAGSLEQGLGGQLRAVRAALDRRLATLPREGILSTGYIVEALLPGFFYPGYGLSGVPLYLIEGPDRYVQTVYWEETLGVSGGFREIMRGLTPGKVATSPPVAQFWNLGSGDPVLLGADVQRRPVLVPSGGVIGFLPGIPPRSIADRQSYVSARIDYLNYLSSTDAYLVSTMDNPQIADLKALIPRVFLLVRLPEDAETAPVLRAIVGALQARPLEVRELTGELKKIGGDMFIFLALENMRIYLVGGLLLALLAITAIALTNYLEDRRTLGLLRVRGASPSVLLRFFASGLLAPALLGVLLGAGVAGVAGFGLTNLIWDLRELQSVVHLLPTRLVISPLTLWISLGVFLMIVGLALLLSLWVFRRSARETMIEG